MVQWISIEYSIDVIIQGDVHEAFQFFMIMWLIEHKFL